MMWPLGIETKIATLPNAIRPSSAQNNVRAQAERSPARRASVRASGRDERGCGSGRLPQDGRVGLGVVGDDGGDRESEQEAQPEQESGRDLFAALGGGDVESGDASERPDEEHEAGPTAQIATEVGAECGESDRDGDVPHDLAEQLPTLVARDRFAAERRVVVGGLDGAHVTTTTGTERRPGR